MEKHVLYVEDDPVLASIIEKNLKNGGFKVTISKDGFQAISFLKETVPDLILLDLLLPSMDGFEVLKKIKSDPATAQVPIIILSNLGSQEDTQRGLTLGANGYLIKAYSTPEEIVAKVRETLRL